MEKYLFRIHSTDLQYKTHLYILKEIEIFGILVKSSDIYIFVFMGKLRLSPGELKLLGIEYNSNENKIPVWGCISTALHSLKGRVKSVIQFSVPNVF